MSLSDEQERDLELERFITREKVQAQFHEQVNQLTDICWDKCVEKPGARLDGRTQTCMINCVERFIDSTVLLTNRFATLLQRSAAM